jgi:hypothetical protein
MVAWQFTAWNVSKKGTVPYGTVCLGRRERSATLSFEHPRRPTQTVPYGTGRFLDAFQAINCLATFILSLRDKKLVRHPSAFFSST